MAHYAKKIGTEIKKEKIVSFNQISGVFTKSINLSNRPNYKELTSENFIMVITNIDVFNARCTMQTKVSYNASSGILNYEIPVNPYAPSDGYFTGYILMIY